MDQNVTSFLNELCNGFNLTFRLAKTALNIGADIATEFLKQPMCSALAPLGTKIAHILKITKCLWWSKQPQKYGAKIALEVLK